MVLIFFGPFALNCPLFPLPLLIQPWFRYISPCNNNTFCLKTYVITSNSITKIYAIRVGFINIYVIGGLCHSLGLGSITTTYVTKELYVINHYAMKVYVTKVCFNSNLVGHIIRTYATKVRVTLAYVTQVYNIIKVIVIRASICH